MDVLNKIKSFIGHAKHNRVKNYEKTEHILDESSSFDTVETYKSIRTNIMFSIPKSEQAKVIAITSSVPGEGKSTTSINLAITFAQMGARVLLMDCDLRKARIHRYLELERQDGVTNVLCGFIGTVLGPLVLRLIKIKSPVARGLGMGCAAHGLGTARAIEMGAVEGAVSGLSIALMGIATALIIPLFNLIVR